MNKNNIIRYAVLTGLWAILLIPFYVAGSMFFPFITGKNFAFRIIVEIIFALWVYLAVIDEAYRPKLSPIAISVGIFVLIMAVADVFATNPFKAFWSNYERMDGWVTTIHLFMYLLVFGSVMKTEKIWLWFFRSSLFASMIMMIYVIKEWITTGSTRVSTTLGNPIYVAVYFLFNFFFALILVYKDVIIKSTGTAKAILSHWATYLYAGAAFLCAFGIWRTSTRGVILGLLGGMIMTALIIVIFEKENKFLKNFSIATLVVLAVIIGGFFAVKNTQFVKNNVTLERFAEISWSDIKGQGQARQYVWAMALKGFEERPILGWGQEGFNYVFNKYYDPRMYSQEQWFDRAHDTPLDILIGGGLLGLFAYLSIFVSALYLIWKKRSILGVTDAALLVGLLAAYFGQNIFVFDNLTSYIFFYVVLSYIYSRDVETSAVKVEKNNHKTLVSDDIANYVVLPILVIVFGTTLWYTNLVPIQANLDIIQAIQGQKEGPTKNLEYFKNAIALNGFGSPEVREQLTTITPQIAANTNIDAQIKQAFVDFTYTQIQAQAALTPLDARYQLFAGVFLNGMGQYALALPYLQEANKLSPTKQTIMFELMKSYSYLGQKEDALKTAKIAYDLAPDFADARSNYISALILNNKQDVAKSLFGAATTTSTEIIVRTYLIQASAALGKGDKVGAIAQVQRAIDLVPGFKAQGDSIIKGIQDGTVK